LQLDRLGTQPHRREHAGELVQQRRVALDGPSNVVRKDVVDQVRLKHGTLRNQQRALSAPQQMRVVALEHRGGMQVIYCCA
jgi:hypothetical protein